MKGKSREDLCERWQECNYIIRKLFFHFRDEERHTLFSHNKCWLESVENDEDNFVHVEDRHNNCQ